MLPHPKPTDTRQDLPEPMLGELACKVLFGSSFQGGWDHRGQSVEVLQPRLQVEGFLEEVHQGKADSAVMTANSAGPAPPEQPRAKSWRLYPSTSSLIIVLYFNKYFLRACALRGPMLGGPTGPSREASRWSPSSVSSHFLLWLKTIRRSTE